MIPIENHWRGKFFQIMLFREDMSKKGSFQIFLISSSYFTSRETPAMYYVCNGCVYHHSIIRPVLCIIWVIMECQRSHLSGTCKYLKNNVS